jgi:hypothetical protein
MLNETVAAYSNKFLNWNIRLLIKRNKMFYLDSQLPLLQNVYIVSGLHTACDTNGKAEIFERG